MDQHRPWFVSRRNVLKAGAGVAAGLLHRRGASDAASGPRAVSMAMHLHSSYSEGSASMRWHLAQAAATGVDVVWLSDHDWRMSAHEFLTSMSLTSLAEKVDTGTVRLQRVGGNGGGVSALGLNPGGATWAVEDVDARQCASGSLANLTITVDASPSGALSLHVDGSMDASGRTATASKRITTSGTVSWAPARDLPGGKDNTLGRLSFSGTGTLRNLRLDWGAKGKDILAQQRSLLAGPPGPTRYQGLEVSWYYPHFGAYGGSLAIPAYGATGVDTSSSAAVRQLVGHAQAAGSVVSYNHPFGVTLTSPGESLDAARFGAVCRSVISEEACGADLLEVAYPGRGHADIGDHLALWDACLRNGLWLTGTGASDDHGNGGLPWVAQQNRFVTVAWAAGVGQSPLLAALLAGRAFARKLGTWSGTIDLHLDGCPMGSASVSSRDTRQLTVDVSAMPRGGRVSLVGGAVDRAAGTPSSRALATLPGSGRVTLDTRRDCFVRAVVLDGAGQVVGVANPIWSFRSVPPGGIPPRRAC